MDEADCVLATETVGLSVAVRGVPVTVSIAVEVAELGGVTAMLEEKERVPVSDRVADAVAAGVTVSVLVADGVASGVTVSV